MTNQQQNTRRGPRNMKKMTIGGIIIALIGLALANPTIRAKLGLPAQQSNTQNTSQNSSPQRTGTQTPSQPRTATQQQADPTSTSGMSASKVRAASAKRVKDAYDSGTSDLQMEVVGRVKKILRDDNEGSRHQKFLLQMSDGGTVLVAHNIDLAKRVPIHEGDQVTIYGEYEWSEQGGTIHWTHHDPKGWHEDGWIMHNGKTYK